ncbi:DUF6438 domain-containing protein [Novosphingobium silvae]|jgi:hypothetical protein|uniref:DUF6438 domain-containing protein n=1 Tax=Novosphingobium silvae TaxID=2692619 RepID=UPI001F356EF8|nr:DUF6438 domain-containing protein [Novosphingobium silvae]
MRALTLCAIVLGTGLLLCCTPRMQPGAIGQARPREEIRISRGPCFGFCPVYRIAVTPAGRVDFEGERHTAVLGPRSHSAGRDAYEAVRRALAPVRPATGTERAVPCPGAATDMSSLTVEWISADGTRTALTHRMGCRDAGAAQVERTVDEQLRRLGVDGWAAQKTWPGDTRG